MKVHRLFFLLLISIVFFSFTMSSCTNNDDNEIKEIIPSLTNEGKIHNISTSEITLPIIGGYQNLNFTVDSSWKLSTNAYSWVKVSKSSGSAGTFTISINASGNNTDKLRTGTIKIIVDNSESYNICNITQDKISGKKTNNWISDYMSDYYLWNDDFNKIKNSLDYSLEPNEFLNAALKSMTTNIDDGFDYNNTHHYYSHIETISSSNRSIEMANDFGIGDVKYGYLDDARSKIYFIVCYVYKNSPADKAGIKRGTLITKYNNGDITNSNVNNIFYSLIGQESISTITLDINEYIVDNNNITISNPTSITINKESYDPNPILEAKTIDLGTKKVGYLAYISFDGDHDDKILEAFSNFQNDNIDDFILDLRYNGGGYTNTSAMLATAIIGNDYKDKVYTHMTYNKNRARMGETDYLYIGKSSTYPLIVKALSSAINMKRIFVLCTNSTASSSELIINGLRGLDIDVKLIGERTNGKNVGMEVINSSHFTNYYYFDYNTYRFSPITFYSSNAKEFKDYSKGFDMDCDIDEDQYIYKDWGDYINDPLTYTAINYINKNQWPNFKTRNTISKNFFTGNKYKKINNPYSLKGSIVIK